MPRVKFGTFSLEAPGNWTLNSVILAGPQDDSPGKGMLTTKAVQPFQRNLITTLEQVPPTVTVEDYFQRQVDGLREAQVPRTEARPPEKVQLTSGLEGLLTEQVIQSGDGQRVRQMQLIVIKKGIAHTAIASHLDGPSFESARDEFRSMLLSFD